MTRSIEIEVAQECRIYPDKFTPVRRSGGAELGWAELTSDDFGYRFPAIVRETKNARGYAVYTVADWQAPPSTFGDLTGPYDWAFLTMCGTGQFTGTGPKSSDTPATIAPFRLAVTTVQWDHLAADFGADRVGVTVGPRPVSPV